MSTVIGSSQPIQKAEKKPFGKRQEKKQKREFFVDSKSEETAKETTETTEE